MSNKIMKIIAYSKEQTINIGSLLKSIGRCLKEADRENINKANLLLDYDKEKQKAMIKAITY